MTSQLWAVEPTTIAVAGRSVIVGYGPMKGGFITNPQLAADQGLPQPRNLYVSLIGPADISPGPTTFEVFPGRTFIIPEDFTGNVWVNSGSTGHRFSGLIIRTQTVTPFTESDFPPASNTMLGEVIASYLYQQYSDDDDLQAFVDSYNQLAQQFHDWFLNANLPIYTKQQGLMLDWVAEGLYGMKRPLLPSNASNDRGPLNTIELNTIPMNDADGLQPVASYMVDDDLFRRILEWHFWKGDGKQFSIQWLKRRVMRFLMGPGSHVDQTYDVSVTFGPGNQVDINFRATVRYAIKGAVLNGLPLNDWVLNELVTGSYQLPVSPYVPLFKVAVEAGLLELPFQYDWHVNVN